MTKRHTKPTQATPQPTNPQAREAVLTYALSTILDTNASAVSLEWAKAALAQTTPIAQAIATIIQHARHYHAIHRTHFRTYYPELDAAIHRLEDLLQGATP